MIINNYYYAVFVSTRQLWTSKLDNNSSTSYLFVAESASIQAKDAQRVTGFELTTPLLLMSNLPLNS